MRAPFFFTAKRGHPRSLQRQFLGRLSPAALSHFARPLHGYAEPRIQADQGQGRQGRGPAFLRPARPLAALHHPGAELIADLFADGIGFDGSSIRGFQAINESDMLLMPDPDTALIDPFTRHRRSP